MATKIAVEWSSGPVKGRVAVRHGRFRTARLGKGQGKINGAEFACTGTGPVRLELTFDQVALTPGAFATTVSLETGEKPFHKEGLENCFWVLIDYGSVIVHVFQEEYRNFYSLESLWADANIEKLDDNK